MTIKKVTTIVPFKTCLGIPLKSKDVQEYASVAYGKNKETKYITTLDGKIRIYALDIKKKLEEFPNAKNTFEGVMDAINKSIPKLKKYVSDKYKFEFYTGAHDPNLCISMVKEEKPSVEKNKITNLWRKICPLPTSEVSSNRYDIDMYPEKVTPEKILEAAEKASSSIDKLV